MFKVANALFHAIEEDKKAEIRLTFVELYNDSFIDLLGKDDDVGAHRRDPAAGYGARPPDARRP